MLYNRGGILSVSIDRSCIPANLQKLQGSFNNSLETNPILNVVGSGEAHAFCFFTLLYSLVQSCTRFLTSMVQYPCNSFDLLWLSLDKEVCTSGVAYNQVDSFWQVYYNHWKGKTTSCLHNPGTHWAQSCKVRSTLHVLRSSEVFSTLLNWAPCIHHTCTIYCVLSSFCGFCLFRTM